MELQYSTRSVAQNLDRWFDEDTTKFHSSHFIRMYLSTLHNISSLSICITEKLFKLRHIPHIQKQQQKVTKHILFIITNKLFSFSCLFCVLTINLYAFLSICLSSTYLNLSQPTRKRINISNTIIVVNCILSTHKSKQHFHKVESLFKTQYLLSFELFNQNSKRHTI